MKEFDRLVDIVKTLRSENGCPWDRKQTLYSLKQNVVEEVYEFIDALDRKDIENIKEELGDMLLHVVFHSIIAQQDNLFSLEDVIKGINEKLIRRHPHVFGNVKVNGVDEVLKNWDEIKQKEKKTEDQSILDTIPKALPPIEKALKIQKKAAKVGFDFKDSSECFEKVEEEFEELKEAIDSNSKDELRHEIGDMFFALINFSRLSGIDPSEALRFANNRFEQRFRCMEQKAKLKGVELKDLSIQQQEELYQSCK
ncbi:nucleoside triphosphate pyrophosphohydrolase [Hippea jasoniae]|uniref:nucleoside triphosphate pyrophosphohydrolase n=1 Tax=Hippea jasoniae TaxID=944479 RepID=UPI000550D086|nr:nucleoside triphosphate pyrophosphohydrolase [Hippea jasoniae]